MNRLWDIDELRKFIKNEASGGITKEEVEQLINDAISKIDTTEKLIQLWKNPKITAEFPTTTINLLDLLKYKKYIIYYYNLVSERNILTKNIYTTNSTSSLDVLSSLTYNTETGINERTVKIQPLLNTIIFNNCIIHDYVNNTNEENNKYIIPYLIFGVI